MKDSFDVIGYFFVNIINESFSSCHVPQFWKQSTVTPVPKIKHAIKCSDFRPINVLPIHEKLIESTVHTQLMDYINKNNILIDEQAGFREHHSCETSLNLVLSTWKSDLNKGLFIISVFLDFKRAFETVDHRILLSKLKRIGFADTALTWIESYLSDRVQRTDFCGQTSDFKKNPFGVPQGSILGPLLFILYINDINTSVRHCKVNLFADDTLLNISSSNLTDAVQKINQDLESLSLWLRQNKLKLNVQKTKYMLIGRKSVNTIDQPTIQIDNEQIERVNEFKYLGILIDEKLIFDKHINNIVKKTAMRIGILYRASNKLTSGAKLCIYNAMIKPHFQYCSTILFLCNNCDLDKLQVQQNKVMRLILKCSNYTHVNVMLDKLKWLSVRQLIYFNVLSFIYRMQNNELPRYLCENVTYVYQHHSLNTRSKNNICLHNMSKSTTQNSLFYKGFKMYNELPATIKSSSPSKFSKLLKEHIITHFTHT